MATFLYRLGRFCYRRRWVVVATWTLLLALVGVGAAALAKPASNSFTIPGTQSQRALDLLTTRLPGSGGASARVVFVAPHGQQVTSPAVTAAVEGVVTRLTALPKVASVADPYKTKSISPDLGTAFATVTYTVEASEITKADQDRLLAAGRTAQSAGLRVEFGGEAAKPPVETGATEGLGLIVAAVVLVVTFGSLLAAGLPLLTAGVGVGLGLLGIRIASGFTDMSTTSGTLAIMLGLAVAIDYALFIVSRYRHEFLVGRPGDEAAGRAMGTAGSAVVFAGATVVIALAALSVVGIPFLTSMGLAAAGTVACAVLIALTLLPALLSLLGGRLLGRKGRAARDTEGDDPEDAPDDVHAGAARHHESWGARWARLVDRRRVPVLLAIVIGLGALSVPALDLRLGMPSDGAAPTTTTQRRAYDALAHAFGPGVNGPLLVVADLTGSQNAGAAAARIQADLAAVQGVGYASSATVNPAGDLAIYTLIPTSGPADRATENLVHALRANAAGWQRSTGATVSVTGATAVAIDVSQTLHDALVPYLAVVVGLAFALLLLVFRSIVVPIKATAGFLLSMTATLGAVVAVFQKGWDFHLIGVDTPGPILSFLPILLIGLLFGLAMDYQVFLVTRMREEHVHGASARDAVVHGFRHGGRVVTAAAVIMISVFAGFVLTDDTTIKSMGFALAVGVFFDAFLIRMALVPAVMSMLGESAWWIPRWLDRLLPDVDVEGEKLTRLLAADDTEPVPALPASPLPR
jgi:RND superfamily putative drug exporter